MLRSCLAATLMLYKVTAFSFHPHMHPIMTATSSSLRSRKAGKVVATTAMKSSSAESPAETAINGNSANGGIKNTLTIVMENQPLQRKHERILFAVYLLAGMAMTRNVTQSNRLVAQSTIALIWMTFSLAISFMEAWVKFKAPLLRKYVAVDVGRHVFCAQHAVELGLAIVFWSQGRFNITSNPALYYSAIVSTATYLMLAFLVGPLLYFRAKYKMVNEAVPEDLTKDEAATLDSISAEIQGKQPPDARWHIVYVALDAVKVVGLGLFAKSCFAS